MKRVGMIIGIMSLLVGCGGNFHQIDTKTTGYLPAVSHAPVRVTVNHALDTNQYKSMAYVSIQMHGLAPWPEYQDYVMQGIKHFGFFDQVMTRQPTVYINTAAFEPTQIIDNKAWVDVDNHIPFNSLLKEYGTHFLVFDVELYTRASDPEDFNSYLFELKIIEPQTRRVLMVASNSMYVREGIDKGVINPVLNFALGYLNFNDSAYPKPTPEPKTFDEWWEQITNEFTKAMFV
ncbi:MAG: hypothetical protein ACHQAX_08300 [Gammaproteobacteria bacterium]